MTNFLQIGQRSDVLFTPKPGNSSYWMRSLQSGRFCGRALQPEGRVVLLLGQAPENDTPKSTAWPPPVDDGSCKNVLFLIPHCT